MSESNQDGYRSLGWIINKSEQGLFLAVADEAIQQELINTYRQGAVEVYDYKRHPGEYSFPVLGEWVAGLPETHVFMIANFQLALQDEDSLKRLNFSRDMLEGLGKNLIFFVTPYGDNRLAVGAYDFYSFVKLRILFHDDMKEKEEKRDDEKGSHKPLEEREWSADELKQKLEEAYGLIEQAEEKTRKAHYYESEKILLKARDIKERILGPEHLEMSEIDNALAGVYKAQGNYKKAEELYKRSLKIRKRILGEEHPGTAVSYNNLAGIYECLGEYKKAEELFKKGLTIMERTLGENHSSTAMGYNNLAYIYENQGKYRQAEKLYEKSLGITKKILGEEHLDTATSYNNLASLYKSQGVFDKAEKLYEKSLGIIKKILGEEHPDAATSYNNLASLYESQGVFDKAEKLYEKSLRIREKVLGEEHPYTAASYNNLAGIYKSRGEYKKAEELYEKGLQIQKRVFGEEHPSTAISYNNLAGIYKSRGEYKKAEELYRKSLHVRRMVLGEEHPSTAASYNNLAGVYVYQNKYEIALAYQMKAFKIFIDILGFDHPNTQVSLQNMKITYEKWNPEGDFEQWLDNKMNEQAYMDYQIRQLRECEYPILSDFLYEAIFVPEDMEKPPKSILERPELQVYIADFGKEDDWCLVAERDGKILGAVWARIMNDYGHIDDETPSIAISLYKEYRHGGIGTALMNAMVQLLKEKGYKQASLSVQKANYAVHLYQNVGFQILEEKEEEYLMVCTLQ